MKTREITEQGFKERFSGAFPGFDCKILPEPLIRVSSGPGGETYLIKGSEKTALYDCGMCIFGEAVVKNIHEILDPLGKTLDYIIISHTHYDHIGALPYILNEWPDAKVCGAEKAIDVFKSEGARATMRRLGLEAENLYGKGSEVITEPLRLDIVMNDGDTLSLGDTTIEAIVSKGHTDCSMSYMLSPQKILMACESIGTPISPGFILTSPLKSVEDSIVTAEKLNKLDFDYLVVPHYGMAAPGYKDRYIDDYIMCVKEDVELIRNCLEKGMSFAEAADAHAEIYYNSARSKEQPYAAYRLNTEILVKQVARSMGLV